MSERLQQIERIALTALDIGSCLLIHLFEDDKSPYRVYDGYVHEENL